MFMMVDWSLTSELILYVGLVTGESAHLYIDVLQCNLKWWRWWNLKKNYDHQLFWMTIRQKNPLFCHFGTNILYKFWPSKNNHLDSLWNHFAPFLRIFLGQGVGSHCLFLFDLYDFTPALDDKNDDVDDNEDDEDDDNDG